MSELYTKYPRCTLWLIQDDEFTMGGDASDAKPHFEAECRSIYIGKTVITNEQYEAFDPAHERAAHTPGNDDAVVNVSFEEATAYCRWYAELTHKNFRLPTEMEWEYACRGNVQKQYYWGSHPEQADAYLCDSVNYQGQLPELETLKPNKFGLYDMLGTVWEWTSSLYLPYPIDSDDGRDELKKDGPRVARGGSFKTHRNDLGCGVRNALDSGQRFEDVGFRIVRFL